MFWNRKKTVKKRIRKSVSVAQISVDQIHLKEKQKEKPERDYSRAFASFILNS